MNEPQRISIGNCLALALVLGAVSATDVSARAHSVAEAVASANALELKIPRPETFELKSGIRVYYIESKRLPLVTIRASVRAGSIWEPSDRQGAAALTGNMLRTGGTARWSADEVNDELDYLAAQLGSRIGDEQGTLTLNTLTENLSGFPGPEQRLFGYIVQPFSSGLDGFRRFPRLRRRRLGDLTQLPGAFAQTAAKFLGPGRRPGG